MPYLNRAIAKESLGVAAAARGDSPAAQALWRSALADCDAAIERDSKEFAAWFDRGNIRMRLEQWGDALTDFSTAADLAPGLPGGHATAGMRAGAHRVSMPGTACLDAPQPRSSRPVGGGILRVSAQQLSAAVVCPALEPFLPTSLLLKPPAGYRLRQAALLFQNEDETAAARMMQVWRRTGEEHAEDSRRAWRAGSLPCDHPR